LLKQLQRLTISLGLSKKIFFLGNLKERNHLEDLGIDGIIIPEWILGTQSGKVWTG
jgi:hypothetical protein